MNYSKSISATSTPLSPVEMDLKSTLLNRFNESQITECEDWLQGHQQLSEKKNHFPLIFKRDIESQALLDVINTKKLVTNAESHKIFQSRNPTQATRNILNKSVSYPFTKGKRTNCHKIIVQSKCPAQSKAFAYKTHLHNEFSKEKLMYYNTNCQLTQEYGLTAGVGIFSIQ
jgi:hypothetical protein